MSADSVKRIPGGVGSQIESIKEILGYVDSESPLDSELVDWIDEEFMSRSDDQAMRVINYLIHIEVLQKTGNRLTPGPEGVEWIKHGSPRVYSTTFSNNITGFHQVIEQLFRYELTAEEIHAQISDIINVDWETSQQVTRRLDYLRSIGYVEFEDGTYSLTEDGCDFIKPKTVQNQFQSPPDQSDILDLFDGRNPPELYLVVQDIVEYDDNQILIPKNNRYDISPRELSTGAIFIHLDGDEFHAYSRQSGTVTETTETSAFHPLPVDVVRFDDPISIREIISELLPSESVDHPDSYPFSLTGLVDTTIGELGVDAAKIIFKSVSTDRTYAEAVPEYEFENLPTQADIGNLYFPGDGVLSEIIGQMTQALTNGQHIVLVGPPGTGKSELAKQVGTELTNSSITMVTATADWSSFDTIGGYQPEGQSGLNFSPGVFLERFQDNDGNPTNEWLIVDELNRANVDKAFGSLFSTLAGDSVTTPFKTDDGSEIELVRKKIVSNESVADNRYCVPNTWRLIATMNTHDKMSLFNLSYAFIRRFAFIHVGAPDKDEITTDAMKQYLNRWNISVMSDPEKTSADVETPSENTKTKSESPPEGREEESIEAPGGAVSDEWVEQLKQYWSQLQSHRALGPAVIEKVAVTASREDVNLTRPTKMYVIPQLEDLPRQTQINAIDSLLTSSVDLNLDHNEIINFSEDYLGISRDKFSNEY